MSFGSFVSQSQLPTAVRVRMPPSANPALMDEAYRATTSPLSSTNADGWTATPPPPATFSSDDLASPDDLVQNFSNISKSVEKSREAGKIVEWLTIDKQISSAG